MAKKYYIMQFQIMLLIWYSSTIKIRIVGKSRLCIIYQGIKSVFIFRCIVRLYNAICEQNDI